MSTLNTKNNMYGFAGILDSEKINIKANDKLFIDPNTKADACNERLKTLKQRYLELAPYAKSSTASEESAADTEAEDDIASVQFSHQSSASTPSSHSFKKQNKTKKRSDGASGSKTSASSKSSRTNINPRKLFAEPPTAKSIPGQLPSEVSARQFYNNPIALQCMRSDLLDDIHELKQQLIDEGVNIDNLEIPRVDQAPDIDTLRLIKGILVRKTRKLQTNSIVEDILFMMLKGIEQLFDGKTEVFGAKPNLKGLTKALTLKFRNQRQHFTQILEEVCEKYGVGANSKLVAQMTISSIKRAIINKDQSEDYSSNIKQLQTMYNQRSSN